ncbi:transmembrane sensor [Novosphingobium sp. SG751A]|uniref:FecR family protein n=1 Tax=Novosphingobium sp. SG751A TaxID=2587000 RepID=UPI0015528B98|nr:FecR domain-containing protein [Novosphingobium sp. SG751A]NOW46700.1 transmembrane sensor [Novosphingobium sp. SG751A]
MHPNEKPSLDTVVEEAIRWHLAISGDDMDWERFTLWLDASPEHRTCYQEVAIADAGLIEARHKVLEAMEAQRAKIVAPSLFGYRALGIGAVAAVAAAVFTLPLLLHEPELVYTAGAQMHTVTLADGSQAVLAPHSRLTIKGADQGHMGLEGGAWFTIRHVPSRTLEIAAGPLVIRDIGTSFDVRVDGSLVRIGVTDGQVAVSSAELAKPLNLQRGKALLYNAAASFAETQNIDPSIPGSWRGGALRYQQTPLSLVALDLERYAGIRLGVPVELRDRRFTGILTVKDEEATKRDLAQLLGLTLVRDAGGDRLSASGR